MRMAAKVLALSLGLLMSGVGAAQTPEGWHGSLKEGLDAAARSGRAVLLITAWKPGV